MPEFPTKNPLEATQNDKPISTPRRKVKVAPRAITGLKIQFFEPANGNVFSYGTLRFRRSDGGAIEIANLTKTVADFLRPFFKQEKEIEL
jgi:hypothetical protein